MKRVRSFSPSSGEWVSSHTLRSIDLARFDWPRFFPASPPWAGSSFSDRIRLRAVGPAPANEGESSSFLYRTLHSYEQNRLGASIRRPHSRHEAVSLSPFRIAPFRFGDLPPLGFILDRWVSLVGTGIPNNRDAASSTIGAMVRAHNGSVNVNSCARCLVSMI